jgi:ADP-ribose pyrophosphatase
MGDSSMPEILGRGRFLTLVNDAPRQWEYVRRNNPRPPVGIIAKDDKNQVLLIEQYRPPVDANVIEIPAGLVGDHAPDESMEAAARRELFEETGYEAGRIEWLTRGPTSAGLASELIDLVRAHDVRYIGEAKGDGTEQITLYAIDMNAVDGWLAEKAAAGVLIDAKVYTALYFLRLNP